MREKTLERKARDIIVQKIMESGEMDTEDIMDLIRPHYLFDPSRAREQAIRRKANQLAAQVRDERGIRTVFNCKEQGVSKYVNIEVSNSLEDLKSIEGQLTKKLNGLNASRIKTSRRRAQVEGQLSLDLENMM